MGFCSLFALENSQFVMMRLSLSSPAQQTQEGEQLFTTSVFNLVSILKLKKSALNLVFLFVILGEFV